MDARSLSDFLSHNGYGCPLPLQAATAAAAADGSAVCFFSWGLTCLAAWVKNEFDADAVGRNSPSGPKQPQWTETALCSRCGRNSRNNGCAASAPWVEVGSGRSRVWSTLSFTPSPSRPSFRCVEDSRAFNPPLLV